MTIKSVRMLTLLATVYVTLLLPVAQAVAQSSRPPQSLPSETPAEFKPTDYGFDYTRRDVMIPMRDGVKLHTVILVPKGAKGAPLLSPPPPSPRQGPAEPL